MLPIFVASQVIVANVEVEEFEGSEQRVNGRITAQLRFEGKDDE